MVFTCTFNSSGADSLPAAVKRDDNVGFTHGCIKSGLCLFFSDCKKKKKKRFETPLDVVLCCTNKC